MPDYSDLLNFLSKNPPQLESERQLHASLLELMAQCLRNEELPPVEETNAAVEPLEERIVESHIQWVRFN